MTAEERRDFVLSRLEELGIKSTIYNHPPLHTVDDALKYWVNIPGATHCKNLFFRNHKGNKHYLVIMECHKQLDIHDLEHTLHQGKLSFASEQRMDKYLGTVPGSVSLFGLLNDKEKEVFLFLDKDLIDAEFVSFHPNDNTASLVISHNDLLRFIEIWGGQWSSIEV